MMHPRPAILVVDPEVEQPAGRAISHRLGSDYEVLTETAEEAGLSRLADLEGRGVRVALVLATRGLRAMGWESFFEEVHARWPTTKRALVVGWTEVWGREPSAREDLSRASTLGLVDSYVFRSGEGFDESFYADVSELLVGWAHDVMPGFEAARVVGEPWDQATHELRDMLNRSSIPSGFYEAGSAEGRRLLQALGVSAALPVAVLHDGRVLSRPSAHDIAAAFGVDIDRPSEPCDLVVVGAGPAGLASAVNAASEGLDVIVVEREVHGGQAGTSSMIRNYLGFPRGISGAALSARAFSQAVLFGARFLIGRAAVGLRSDANLHVTTLDDGTELQSRAVVLATGVSYRRLGDRLDRFLGRGVYYGAATTEAPAMRGRDVVVIGGANSAGQAAVYLARFARSVTLLVRGPSLAVGMSDYLIRELDALPNVAVRTGTEFVDAEGAARLAAVVVRDDTGVIQKLPAEGAFVLIGAAPRTEWLPDELARDEAGFVRTGAPESAHSPFGTSLPGIFAVGDVRAESVKRVASAVGEGSVVVRSVHEHLARVAAVERPRPRATNGRRA